MLKIKRRMTIKIRKSKALIKRQLTKILKSNKSYKNQKVLNNNW